METNMQELLHSMPTELRKLRNDPTPRHDPIKLHCTCGNTFKVRYYTRDCLHTCTACGRIINED